MKKHALLIGVEDYRDESISPLNYACSDAKALGADLSDKCGFDNVRVLASKEGDDEPTLVNIINALQDVTVELSEDDLFLFFFAGHGIEKSESAYLLASDSVAAFPDHASLSLDLLRKNFESLSVGKRVVLLDACRNNPEVGRGDTDNCMSDVIFRDIVVAARSTRLKTSTTVLLSACSSGQRAYEWKAKKHGVFTYYLLEGLRGKAWSEDTLHFENLASYATERVKNWSKNSSSIACEQEPWYEKFGDPGPIILGNELSCNNSTKGTLDSGTSVVSTPYPAVWGVDSELTQSLKSDLDECNRLDLSCDSPKEYLESVAHELFFEWQNVTRQFPNSNSNSIAVAQWLIGCCYLFGCGINQDYEKSVEYFIDAKDQGFSNAQCYLGLCFESGFGVSVNFSEAIDWYSSSANGGNAKAQYQLGCCFLHGKGVAVDFNYAAMWFIQSAKQGHARAQYNLGLLYEDGRGGLKLDMKKAMEWYQKSANNGCADAQELRGMKYLKGEGVKKDKKVGIRYLKQAALNGHANAQYQLGICYENAIGVKYNLSESINNYRAAAIQGHPDGLFNLGRCYEYGRGVNQDTEIALDFYQKAALQGHSIAQYRLGLYLESSGEYISKDIKRAFEWFKKSANQDYPHALNKLGLLYESGLSVDKNPILAFKWFLKAAELDDVDGQFNLGRCYTLGAGVEKNITNALEWYLKAAHQGHSTAQFNVAHCFANGFGCEKNSERAFKWYYESANHGFEQRHGNIKAKLELGLCYAKAIGCPIDYELACRWFRNAAKQGSAEAHRYLGDYLKEIQPYPNWNEIAIAYLKAIKLGDSEAAEKINDELIEKVHRKTSRGDADSHYILGLICLSGLCGDMDNPGAKEWFSSAAGLGHKQAQKLVDSDSCGVFEPFFEDFYTQKFYVGED